MNFTIGDFSVAMLCGPLLAVAAALSPAEVRADEPAAERPAELVPEERRIFSGAFSCDFRSAYLTVSGSLCDTEPITTQCLDYRFDFGEWGYISGYAWTISNLTSLNCENHRMAFNEFEGVVSYGYLWTIADYLALDSQLGILWNPQIGYPDDSWEYRGIRWLETFKTDYVNVGFNALHMIAPNESLRVVVVFDRTWSWGDFSLTPSFQAVWSDGRRYKAKFVNDPVHGLFGGAFATITLGLKATYRINDHLSLFASIQEYVVVDPQARDRVESTDLYYSQVDQTVGTVGFRIPF